MPPVPGRGAVGCGHLSRLRHRGPCAARHADGARIRRECAGITRHFSCLRCGAETGMARRGGQAALRPCSVTWTAARLLDDGTGAISTALKPLADALTTTTSPAATQEWLNNRTSANC